MSDPSLNDLLLSRYEMITAFRELQEKWDMVIELIPSAADDPQYIADMREAQEKMLSALDRSEPILRAMGWEG